MIGPFDNISKKSKKKILRFLNAYTVKYRENKTILENIKTDNEIGIISKGYLQIIRNNYNGTQNIIEELYENSIISSSMIYFDNDDYEIIAKDETELIIVSFDEIMRLESGDKSFNQFIKNLLYIINEKIIEKNERIEILTKKTIRNKLLEYFNISSKKSGSRFIYLPFNFSDLAEYLAIDRSAMSRELKYLKDEKIIEIKGKRITLLYR